MGSPYYLIRQRWIKKEAIRDVCGYFQNWADAVIVRYPDITMLDKMWKEAADVFGFSLSQSSPAKYQISRVNCNDNLKDAIAGKDVICTDSIPSDMKNEFKDYQISKDLMGLANKGAILNPCPPFYRGEEVTEDVIDYDYFVGYEFKQNLLKVQQVIIIYCLSKI